MIGKWILLKKRIMDMREIMTKDVQEYLGHGCVQSVEVMTI